MKKQLLYLLLILITFQSNSTIAASYIWTGNSSSNWTVPGNWSGGGGGTPGSGDNITINSNAPNNLVLDQNRTITNFTINGDTLDLGTYSLTTTGVTYFNGGKILNGNLNISGSLCHFGGAVIDARIEATCGYYLMNGGSFLKPVLLVSTGTASTSGTGNCIFEESLSITHSGTVYFTMGSTYGDSFQNLTITNSSTHEVFIGTSDTTYISGNLILNNTGTGGIVTGYTGGVTYLSSGKTIAIGSGGFTNNYLTLKNFYQQGSTSQTLTLTGTAILNLINANFEGNLTVTTPGILLKNSTFNGTTSITRNGTTGSFHCDGGNTFTGTLTLTNSGTSGRVRMANTTPDTYRGNVTFNSTNGQDVQIAYTGNNILEGNITILSNKVVFNTSNGKVTFAGGNTQTLNGSYNFPFKKLAINKTGGFVTSNATFSVDDTLFFINGFFQTKSTNELTLKLSSKVVGASDSSYVQGPVKKIGNTGFVFPTGANNSYRPIEISAPSTTTSEFVGEFVDDSLLVNTVQRDSSLGFLIRNKYWKLNRTSGTSQVYVTLSWDSLNALVDTFVNVASWNGSQWSNLGKGNVYGSKLSGSIKSTSVATSFNEFILSYFNNEALPSPLNCNNVTDAQTLLSCLTFLPLAGLVQITSNFSIDGSIIGTNLPLEVQSGVILEGMVGSSVPYWWETSCPLITTDHRSDYNNGVKEMFLLSLQQGSTLRNLRIQGPDCSWKDYNYDQVLSGGVCMEPVTTINASTGILIKNCEIFCFSYAGVFKFPKVTNVEIIDCFIHKVKGISKKPGIGYGTWMQGWNTKTTVDFTNIIFDDCKTAIDGQGYPMDWFIDRCSLTQFFHSEDINKHNDNNFAILKEENGVILNQDYHYCFLNTTQSCSTGPAFWGPLCNSAVSCTTLSSFASDPGYTIGWIPFGTNGIPMYDVGGADTKITNSIFHKKRTLNTKEGGNGNINLTFPNQDINQFGDTDNTIEVNNNTFATKLFTAEEAKVVNNRGGHFKISDNFAGACVWDGNHVAGSIGNSFEYESGQTVVSGAPQPCDFELQLKDQTGTTNLPTGFTFSPSQPVQFMQYTTTGTPIKLFIDATFPDQTYLIRTNQNPSGVTGTAADGVLSNENYFNENEIRTATISSGVSIPGYPLPGLYGIDVLAFDANPVSGTFDFKSSQWKHIPVIVQPTAEKMLYFNIMDSYPSSIGGNYVDDVFKQVELNGTPIWQESINEGGDGWELVSVDLKGLAIDGTTHILDLIHLDGEENVLTFSIVIGDGAYVTYQDLRGLIVWVDDVYLQNGQSITADNVIKDGSIELSKALEFTSSPNDYSSWYQVSAYEFSNCAPLAATSGAGGEPYAEGEFFYPDGTRISTPMSSIYADGGISSIEKRSGAQSLILVLPAFKTTTSCSQYPDNNGLPMISVGTQLDFTNIMSCADFIPVGSPAVSPLDFVPFPADPISTPPVAGANYYLDQSITIGFGETLTLSGNIVVVDENITITVNVGGTLNLAKETSTGKRTHLFACGNMWNGIVNDGGVVDSYTNANGNNFNKIEDAVTAISSVGGTTKIRYTSFDNNLTGTKISETATSVVNTQSLIRAVEYLCTDGLMTKEPHLYEIPYAHLTLTNIPFTIEVGTNINTTSKYEGAWIGVLVVNSSANIGNNAFRNIHHRPGNIRQTTISSAIMILQDNPNVSREIIIGGDKTASHKINKFNNVSIGIYGKLKNTNNSIKIFGNSFNNSEFFIEPVNPNFHNTAITLHSSRPIGVTSSAPCEIYSNDIVDFRLGIHAINMQNMRIGIDINDDLFPNRIDFHLGVAPDISMHYAGIWLQYCRGAYVIGGNDKDVTDIENDYEASMSGLSNFRGISIENSPNSRINCNIIRNIPRSITLTGNCFGSLLRKNYMENYEVGIDNYLTVIGAQGFQNTSNNWEALDNEWQDGDPFQKRVGGSFNQPQLFNWYHKTSNSSFEPIPNDGGFNSVSSTIGSAQCTDYFPQQRDALYSSVINDTLSFDEYSDAYSFMVKYYAFETFKSDTTILIEGRSSDSLFQSFYDSTETNIIGQFNKVIQLASDSATLELAVDLLATINVTKSIEANLKEVLSIYLTKVVSGDTLSSTDSTTLAGIAGKDWVEGGMAIYIAAAILGLEIHPQITSLRLAGNVSSTSETPMHPTAIGNSIKLHPNPANETLFVQGINEQEAQITIYDIEGKLVLSKSTTGNCQLDISMLHIGVYRLQVHFINGDVSNHKFIKFKL